LLKNQAKSGLKMWSDDLKKLLKLRMV